MIYSTAANGLGARNVNDKSKFQQGAVVNNHGPKTLVFRATGPCRGPIGIALA